VVGNFKMYGERERERERERISEIQGNRKINT
jgi:hypothetical protein